MLMCESHAAAGDLAAESSSNTSSSSSSTHEQHGALSPSAESSGSSSNQEEPFLPNYAYGCKGPTLQSWPQGPPRVPPLSPGQNPNFIMILVDDMGYDDIGLHHPRAPDGVRSAGAQTPNIDKLIKSGMSFTNFYSAPLCAMGRAEFLTGRSWTRTGTLFNGFGYDAFSLSEATMGDVMQQAGYMTAHYGKWHNGDALGYEPWWRGFSEAWLPSKYIPLDNLMRHNRGTYVQTKGLMEQVLANKMMAWMKEREEDGKPFMIYYAPYAIHRNVNRTKGFKNDVDNIYFQPEPYLSKILAQDPTPDPHNARVWSYLAYLDEVLGGIFDFVAASPKLAGNTYIMLTGDNGPGLPLVSDPLERLRRLPSGMQGDKTAAALGTFPTAAGSEGSLRNHLAVWGPGVPSGATDDTLLTLADVLPTMAELANATNTKHRKWSGRSFANLLAEGGRKRRSQAARFHFVLGVSADKGQCPPLMELMQRQLPDLGPDREVLRPQPLLSYDVYKRCIVGRYRDFKWYGVSNKVYRMNGTHIEKPCNEVRDPHKSSIAARFDAEAAAWWQSVVAEPDSFTKPVYQLGLQGEEASNVEAEGAVQITRGSVTVSSRANYTRVGDNVCMKATLHTPGHYTVTAMYIASALASGSGRYRAEFRLLVGKASEVAAGSAASITSVLGPSAQRPGSPASSGSIIGLVDLSSTRAATAAALALGVPAGMPLDTIALSSTDVQPAEYEHFKPTPDMLELERRMRAATRQASTYIEAEGQWGGQVSPQASSSSSGGAGMQQAWWKLQQKYGWPDGQVVFKSLYAPCPVDPGQCSESCG
ncbi:hypothetical protein OEZ85_009698 [Tetradesmus obliquus]|uniref:Sulfatase N-terminal domain-containing protein n=1 Tax=Tetradesmus obliquus TaxID=3088 RepID=A0ABY8UCW8_TETOB|nr:hypothetical protein OEZ85_009698 [Tetradesmus obliquus]